MENLSDIVIVTGFETKGAKSLEAAGRLASELHQRIPSREPLVISGCPKNLGHMHPNRLVDGLDRLFMDHVGEGKSIVAGYSYGALLSLGLACRRRLSHIAALALIEGPLRSDVTVAIPPALQEAFSPFQSQYDCRVDFARQCEIILTELDRSRVLTLGSQIDRVVPPTAKRLDGVTHLELQSTGHDLEKKIDEIVEVISHFAQKTLKKTDAAEFATVNVL